MEQKIKSFVLLQCPHCAEKLFVEMLMQTVDIKKVYKPSDIRELKENLKKQISDGNYMSDKDEEKKLFEYIDQEDNILDEEDIATILNQLAKKLAEK